MRPDTPTTWSWTARGRAYVGNFGFDPMAGDGALTNRRVWAEFGPLPTDRRVPEALAQVAVAGDGCCLDAEGGLWVADATGDRLVRVVEGERIGDCPISSALVPGRPRSS